MDGGSGKARAPSRAPSRTPSHGYLSSGSSRGHRATERRYPRRETTRRGGGSSSRSHRSYVASQSEYSEVASDSGSHDDEHQLMLAHSLESVLKI